MPLSATLKQAIVGTPLEAPARAVYRRLRRWSGSVGAPDGGPGSDPASGPPAQGDAPAADANATYDAQTAEVIARTLARDSNCVDVGCHEGAVLDDILKHAPDGLHFAFEPLPDLAERLRAKYRDTVSVRLHELALSDRGAQSITFHHVTSNPGYSGFEQRRYDRPSEEVTQIQVATARLDDELPPDMPIALIKIDVEGAELQVLRGGRETLRRWQPVVVFEHGLGAADVYGTRPEVLFDELQACGLRVSLMADWLAGRADLTRASFVDEFDTARNYYFMAHP